jgi:hypothetical protein
LDIVCALINKYHCPAIANIENSRGIAVEMRKMWKEENALQKYLEQLNQETTLRWSKYNAAMCLFPVLTEDDVHNLTFGIAAFQSFVKRLVCSRFLSNQNGKVLHC